MDNSRIQNLLDRLKSQEKVAPSGMAWQNFYLMLKRHKKAGGSDPLVPLILGASAESPASKHWRLQAQLSWAQQNNCLDQALEFLEKLEDYQWDTSPAARWDTDSYMRPH
jgi:hypothetical protein